MIQKKRSSFCSVGSLKDIITKNFQMVISFFLFMINQVKKKLVSSFLKVDIIISNLHSNSLLSKKYRKRIFQLSLCNGDIEPSSELKKNYINLFLLSNLNSIIVHDLLKMTLLKPLATPSQCNIYVYQKHFLTLQSKAMAKD